MIGCAVPGCPCPHSGAGMTVRDEIEVDTVVQREQPVKGLTRAEKLAVTARLTAKGRSAREIARVVGTSSRTVVRWRRAVKETTS